MPFLVRFLVWHALVGFGLAIVFVGALTALDVFHLGALLRGSEDGLLALGVLTFAVGLTFGSVQMGFAVMLMSDEKDPPRGRRARLTRLVPIPVRVPAKR